MSDWCSRLSRLLYTQKSIGSNPIFDFRDLGLVVRIVAFQAIGSGSIPGGLNLSGVAQWKRVGLITQRSKDRNLLPLFLYILIDIEILSLILMVI